VRVIRLEAAVFDEPTGDWMRPSRAAADDSHRFRSLASDEVGVTDGVWSIMAASKALAGEGSLARVRHESRVVWDQSPFHGSVQG
jgi:hypothetical protein